MSYRLRYSLVIAAFVAGSSQMASQTLRYNPGDPLQFGMGYNTLTGEYAGKCTVDVLPKDVGDAGQGVPEPGQLTKWELSSVEDLAALSDKLDFSASASASFIAGSVSASTRYIRSKSFNTFHQFVVVDTSVVNSTKIWLKPDLTPEMKELYRTDTIGFLARCGDTFVRTITSGGELTAIIDLSTSAQEDLSSLSVAISGNYGTAEGKSELRQQLQKTLLNRQSKVSVVRAGGTGGLPSYSAEALIAASLSFGDVVLQHPYPMLAGLASYGTVITPKPLTIEQERFIRPILIAYRRAMQYSGDLAYLRARTSEFRQLFTEKKDESTEQSLHILLDHSIQPVVSGDFVFKDVDRSAINQKIDAFENYSEELGALARTCLANPTAGCSGKVPAPPEQLAGVVRVFVATRPWDTAAGPVDIHLDSAWVCKVTGISGLWRPREAPGDMHSCDDLPKGVTNGYIVTGGFDNYYPDNHGTCNYEFLCYRR